LRYDRNQRQEELMARLNLRPFLFVLWISLRVDRFYVCKASQDLTNCMK